MEMTKPFGFVSASPTSDIYIVGGGPSLSGFNLNVLSSRTVICVNDGILFLPWAYAVVSADLIWMQKRAENLQVFAGHKYLVAAQPGQQDATWLLKVREPGLSSFRNEVHIGGTSGYAALNIAYLAGAKTIHLLGYDYHSPGVHWFGRYPWRSSADEDLWQKWATAYNTTLPQLAATGVTVYNYSPQSRVTAFQKRELRELPY